MNKKFVVPFNLLLIAISLILLAISFINVDNLASQFTIICEMILLIIAVLYIVFDYSKDGAKYFKAYFIFYAATYLIETAIYDVDFNDSTILLILTMVVYGNVLLLGFGKDLGKVISYCLAIFNIAIYGYNLFSFLIDSSFVFLDIIIYIAWFIESLISFIMVSEKYRDKQLRNTN